MNLIFIRVILTLSLFCSISFVWPDEPIKNPLVLSFHDLENAAADGKDSYTTLHLTPIEIRGFLYTASDGKTVLASEPNLKSCCVGSQNKRLKQLIVYADAPLKPYSSDVATTLKGILETDPNGQYLYTLKNAVISDTKSNNYTRFLMGALLILILLSFCFRLLKHK